MKNGSSERIRGLFLVIDRRNERGLAHWAQELKKRLIPAVILLDEQTLENSPALAKDLVKQGFEIGCSYNGEPFWDVDYNRQYAIMERISADIQTLTNRLMRIFGSKYFAYNESTLKIADKLGIEYLFARGTAGPKAVVYKPEEYRAKIVSVSNVPSRQLGTGSLCDESLRCRGETPESLRSLLFRLKEDPIILVAQTHVSGVKLHWWDVYRDFLDSDVVEWQSIDELATDPILLPNAQIPLNDRADYRVPKPKIPLEDEPEFPSKN